jgi:hypothetical protein
MLRYMDTETCITQIEKRGWTTGPAGHMCFATMRLFPRNSMHDGVDHAWFIFNLHTENPILYFIQLHK